MVGIWVEIIVRDRICKLHCWRMKVNTIDSCKMRYISELTVSMSKVSQTEGSSEFGKATEKSTLRFYSANNKRQHYLQIFRRRTLRNQLITDELSEQTVTISGNSLCCVWRPNHSTTNYNFFKPRVKEVYLFKVFLIATINRWIFSGIYAS
jgi:Zn-dependent M32 family carboxypeptidase